MADKQWREIGFGGGQTTDLKKSAPGTALEGQYVGSRKITTDYGENSIYQFVAPDGNDFSVYGFTDLDSKLAQIAVGNEIRMTYEGRFNVNTKRGSVQMHRVRVEVAG